MIDPGLLPALLSLATVGRRGSVGAAARVHHRTSSAISQQLRRLERHFGVKFTERAGRGIRLTSAGEAALPAILQLGDEAEAAFARLGELSGRPTTTVRVAASDYLGKALLVPVLRELLDDRAPLRFEIATAHSRAAVQLVSRGEAEFAIVTGQDAPRGVDAEHLFNQPFVWVAPCRGRPARGPLIERLRREPVLRLAAGSEGRRLLEEYLASERILPVSTIDVPSVSLMLSYVSGGVGIGLAPALALADVDPTRVVTEPARVPALSVALLSRPNARRGAVAARFAARLAAEGKRAGARMSRLPSPRTQSETRR
jgi:DNA-binding transcriptional LysR family regulator